MYVISQYNNFRALLCVERFFYILVSDKYGEDVIMRIIYLCKLTNRLDQSNHPEYDPHTTTQ